MQISAPAGIAMVGFGEAGRAFAKGWGPAEAHRIRAYDIKSAWPEAGTQMHQAFEEAGVRGFDDLASALANISVVFCLVTADQALAAATAATPYLSPGTLWLDGNSCSPGTKRLAADAIGAAGGRYVDVAVMTPVFPLLHRTPLLLAGPDVEFAAVILRDLGMNVAVAGPVVGDASSIKMIRSVLVKGLEAITAECFLAARRAGVEAAVLNSLRSSDPDVDWGARAAYNLGRMMAHGTRRAAEMREVAATLRELGLPDQMAVATATWQDRVAALGLAETGDALDVQLDRVLDLLP